MLSSIIASCKVLKDKTIEFVTSTENTTTNDRLFEEKQGYLEKCSFITSPPVHIIDNIFLSGAHGAANYSVLKNLDIKTIINVTKEIQNYYPDDFKYYKYEILDNDNAEIEEYIMDIMKIIDSTNGNILIHCFLGKSRSASVVIYYLMSRHNMSLDEAVTFVKKKRDINPNKRFIDILKKMKRVDDAWKD